MQLATASRWPNIIVATLLAATFAQAAELHVAAAANLSTVLPELSTAFERQTKIHIVPTLGATAQLTQQIENGAPFDVFLSADVEHVDQLIKNGFVFSNSRAIYALGQLVVWSPRRPDLHSLEDLAKSDVRVIAVAKPELAPYGVAAVETLKNSNLWEKLEKKIVYAPSIAIAKQFADTGNAEAAFTALALTVGQTGNSFTVSEKLHKPINQALGIVKNSKEEKNARAFTAFLAGPEARDILKRFGY
jgi:molybdate transport system substrate-binding protein